MQNYSFWIPENVNSRSSKYWQLQTIVNGELLSSNTSIKTKQEEVACIPEASSSNLDQVSGHPEKFRGNISPSGKKSAILPYLGHRNFQIPSNSLFTNHSTFDAVQACTELIN